ncbi:Rho-GTPase-activating protein 8 [Colletotrichum sidae]|uniref:Rho-GTPase-activating protein 8 n=2 Tax=Colletotrichum orbiculare species complex TaxID=2707354 RepID=N4USR5_COLOR|nr:Rho-GTPase-activating protein 8 [Colletotrichum orbiculare MAFF 240422]TEA19082.1 Rho-GTPase-activating protein 8 [Colletotrichum sidae]
MPGFAESFWSSDYAAGLGVLFGKLQQGVLENRQVLTVARMRAEAEEVYSQRLADIAPASDKVQGGFSRDDGATVRKAFDGMRIEMEEGAKSHKKIAQSIRDLVVNPFSRWCDAHESRIQDSQDDLQARIKAHDRQAELVKKLRSTYFNKCRLVEDIEEETKLAFQDPESSPKNQIPEIKVSENKEPEKEKEKHEADEEDEMMEIGDEFYNPEQVKKMLSHIMNTIKLGETKVPILGTYQNTTAGSDIVEYLQKHLNAPSVSYAERIGQDLITNGFLRLIGNVGSTFANSSKMFYQWRPKAFKWAGVPEKKQPLGRTFSMPVSESSDSPVVGTMSEYLANWNVLNNAHPNESPAERLRREAREADEKYKAGVRKLDELRCDLEENIFLHLRFLERCELDRLKAIKTVVLDFSGTISNVIPSLQSAVDNMMLFQETVQPAGDLRYLLENYRTGSFIPRVVVYENYYNKVDEQTFGVDLEARARADKKRVPVIITTILTYLDNHYPDLEGDELRRNVWLEDVPLTRIHELRSKVNDGKPISPEVFEQFDIPTVASLLKLYLLELPDSLVSSHVYEIVRTIYQTQTQDDDAARVPVLQQTLSQLRLTNIATLDACMNHFTRLIDLTSADETYVASLATTLGHCILRPRAETSLTMEEKHAYRLIRDLFAHKDDIFSELKRMSTLNHTGSINRPRAISTDESNRRANMEERNRALLEKAAGSRGRDKSPAPSPRGHRRDHSVGRPETRFPIQTSPPGSAGFNDRHRSSLGSVIGGKRSSLEVPGSETSSPAEPANGTTIPSAAPAAEGVAARIQALESPVEKRNSLGRPTSRYSLERRVPMTSSAGTESGTSTPRGVTLEDKPMDD